MFQALNGKIKNTLTDPKVLEFMRKVQMIVAPEYSELKKQNPDHFMPGWKLTFKMARLCRMSLNFQEAPIPGVPPVR